MKEFLGQQYVAADIKEAPPGSAPLEIRLGGVSGPSNFLASMHVAADIQAAPPGAAPLEIRLGGGGQDLATFPASMHAAAFPSVTLTCLLQESMRVS